MIGVIKREAKEWPSADRAKRAAQALAAGHAGALAFSRTGDPDNGGVHEQRTWKVNRLEYELESMMPHGKWFMNIEGTIVGPTTP